MEVIIGLHPACCAWPRRSHPPAKPTFRFPSPIKTYDPFSSLNLFSSSDFSRLAQIAISACAAACAAKRYVVQRSQFQWESAYA